MLYFLANIVKDVSVWSVVNVYHGMHYLVYGPVRSEESKQLEELQKMILKQDEDIKELRDLLKHSPPTCELLQIKNEQVIMCTHEKPVENTNPPS